MMLRATRPTATVLAGTVEKAVDELPPDHFTYRKSVQSCEYY